MLPSRPTTASSITTRGGGAASHQHQHISERYALADDEMFDPFVIAHRRIDEETGEIYIIEDSKARRPGSALTPAPVESIEHRRRQQEQQQHQKMIHQHQNQERAAVAAENEENGDDNLSAAGVDQSMTTYEEFYHYAPGHRPLSAELAHSRVNYQQQLSKLRKQQRLEESRREQENNNKNSPSVSISRHPGDEEDRDCHTPEFNVCKRILDRETAREQGSEINENAVFRDRSPLDNANDDTNNNNDDINQMSESVEFRFLKKKVDTAAGVPTLSPNNKSEARRRVIVQEIKDQKQKRINEEFALLQSKTKTYGYMAPLTIESDDVICKTQKKLGAFDIPPRVKDTTTLKNHLTPKPFPATLMQDWKPVAALEE